MKPEQLNIQKNIFVISDLHVGDHGKRDNFFTVPVGQTYDPETRYKLLIQFLKFVREQDGQLIILGDLFEFWQANIGTVLIKNRKVFDLLAEMDVIYVIGNHDIDLKPLIGQNLLNHPFFNCMTESFAIQLCNQTVKFLHGHEVDPYNKGLNPTLGRAMAILAGIAEDHLGSYKTENCLFAIVEKVKEKAQSICHSIMEKWHSLTDSKYVNASTPVQDESLTTQHFEYMKKHKQTEEFDIAIIGHTHLAGKFEDWYVNSGSWIKFNEEKKPLGQFVWIKPSGVIDIYMYEQKGETIIESMFVQNNNGLVTNFDFDKGIAKKENKQ